MVRDMFNKLKREIIQEVINEFQDLCIKYDAEIGAKIELDKDVTFETGIGIGLRKAIGIAYDIKYKYR